MDRDQNEIRENNNESNDLRDKGSQENCPWESSLQKPDEKAIEVSPEACESEITGGPALPDETADTLSSSEGIKNEPLPTGNTVPEQQAHIPFTEAPYSAAAPQPVYVPQAPYMTPPLAEAKKDKKTKKPIGRGALAATVVICALASGLAAFAGTMAAKYIADGNGIFGGNGTSGLSNPSSTTVIHQAVENTERDAGTYSGVASQVTGTVVEITTESMASDTFFWGNYVTEGAGSGVLITDDGYIVTNNHVVGGATNITVKLNTGEEFKARLIGTDPDTDIAVVKIDPSDDMPTFPFAVMGNSDSLTIGEEVITVGNPLGELGGTVTNGIVSALSREITIEGTEMTLIQTNAAVNPGNSGGGLFNMYGELIGIVNAKTTTTSSGTSVEGIGFAIPINNAVKVSEELIEFGYVRGRVMLGITYFDVEDTYDAFYYRVNSLGVYILTSEYNDGLKPYDRIVAIDGSEVTYSSDIKHALKGHEVGDKVEVKVVRDGRYVDVEVTLYEYVPTEAKSDNSLQQTE